MLLNKAETRAPRDCITRMHHDLLLNYSEESLFEGTDRTFKNVYVELPFPVTKSVGTIKPPKDMVCSLLEKKKEYLELLKSKRKRYKNDLKNIVKTRIGNNEFIYLPKHLLEFYQKKDPDNYFNCDYNYYYTNGTLGHLEIGETNFLVYPDHNNEICLLDCQNPTNVIKTEFKPDSAVHSIFTISNSENFIVVRENCCINIFTLNESKKAVLKSKREYKIPLLDGKLNSNNQHHLGMIWANGNVNVNDVESNRTLFHYKSLQNSSEETCDNFQQFQFFDNNLMCVMDRYKIKILDYRTQSLQTSFNPEVIKCNSLCNLRILNNSLLLTSRHYVMKTDIRNFQNLTTYSHTLDAAPCYMDLVSKDEDVYLAVAGQKYNSKVLFTGKSPFSLPYKVPSLIETLEATMLEDPTFILHLEDFRKLFKYSITGLKILNLDGEICIFTSNSLGEIFKQNIYEDNVDNKKSLTALANWFKTVEIPDPELHLTFVEEMSAARFSLNKPTNKKNLNRYKKGGKAKEFLAKFEPRYSKKNVTSAWAKQFLSVWEDSDESDEDNPIDNLPEVPVTDKVGGWIEGHEFSINLDSSFKESQP